MNKFFLFTALISFFLFPSILMGQDLQETKKLFSEGKFAEAKAGAEKLVKATPSNATYNQWYGICLFETGEYDASEKYLEIAAGKSIPEALRYLGQVNYLQYDFNEAVENYEKCIELLTRKKQTGEIASIEPLLEQAKRAARMLSHTEDVQIIDSVVVNKNQFLNYYFLSEESGSITPQENGKQFVYINQLANKRYYAKPVTDSICKLYSQNWLMDKWGDETLLSNEINAASDNNYPFVLSDGVTVYFASKGHGSIGGYDLFITRYNHTNDTYLAPEQLGMPFNSIGNDYMLAIDDLNNIGYFATDRSQPEDTVIVYTFIPNPERTGVSGDDPAVLKNRAWITSIKDTWKAGENYGELLRQVHTQATASATTEIRKDFTFIINDNMVYHQLRDFESDAAKSQFLEYQQLENQSDALTKALEEKRVQYSQASATGKKNLKDSILKDEGNLEKLENNCNRLAVSARNTEINYLRQLNK